MAASLASDALTLGIETSCDETAAAVVRGGREVLSSVVASQHELHEEYRGVVPEIASRAHAERILPVVRAAIEEAGVSLADVSLVAVGHRPGLIGPLLVGVSAAKALAWSLGVPIVGVDHVQAHLHAGWLWERGTNEGDSIPADAFPALGLVVSGGHTALYRCESVSAIRRLGGTIDDAIGEAYDKVAAMLGLAYPGGPMVDRLAGEDGTNDRRFDFPVSRLGHESLDFSFSGLKTAVLYAVRGVPARGVGGAGSRAVGTPALVLDESTKRDLCASFQRRAVEAVVLKIERAIDRWLVLRKGDESTAAPRSLLVGGGVSANSRLRRELVSLASRRGLMLRLPAMAYCVDNAAMIAGLGHELARAGRMDDLTLAAEPTTSVC